MCELDKKKLGKMIDLCLKGELELDEKAFRTLLISYENSVEFIVEPVMVHPSAVMTLHPPPPITRIIKKTVTTTTTTTIERTDFTGCVNELEEIFKSGEKHLQKANDDGCKFKTDEELKLILDANEMVLARD